MADEFYIKNDIFVQVYIPANNGAVWNGFSWDSNAKWGSSSTLQWESIQADIVDCEITYGSSVIDGFSAPLEPGTMNLTMQSLTYDPFNNLNIRSGTQIAFNYRQNPTTAPSTFLQIFYGAIDTVSVTYDPVTSLNTITIRAVSTCRDFLNKNITTWNTTGATTRAAQLAKLQTLTGYGVTDASFGYDYTYAVEYKTDITAGDVLAGITTTERAIAFQYANSPYNIAVQNWNAIATNLNPGTPGVTFSNTHSTGLDHACISDLEITYDASQIYNVIKASLDIVPSVTGVRRLADSITFFGERPTTQVLHLANDSVQLTNWLNNYPDVWVGKRVKSVTTPMIRRDHKLADVSKLEPLDVVRVNVSRTGYTIDQTSIITKVTHTITPDTWFANIELWNGF